MKMRIAALLAWRSESNTHLRFGEEKSEMRDSTGKNVNVRRMSECGAV
jgi:hypothetical protein